MYFKIRSKDESEWEKVFAFWPKPIGRYPLRSDDQEMAWLCFIERKWVDFRESHNYEYRKISKS